MSKHILIVEDDTDIRETLATFLKIKGYEVTATSDGYQALEKLKNGLRPALILLDLMMPEMNGWEFRRRQLADAKVADIPVVVLTGAHFSSEEAASLQALDILTKPVDISRMLGHLANCAS
jgi:CheY-like chemotaxis protein